jgi:hypothetical protein
MVDDNFTAVELDKIREFKRAEQFINSEQYSNLVYAHFSKDKADALINFSRNYGLNFLKNHEVKK